MQVKECDWGVRWADYTPHREAIQTAYTTPTQKTQEPVVALAAARDGFQTHARKT